MAYIKYHAELDFGYGQTPIRFTSQELDVVMARFCKEIVKEKEARNERREYSYIEHTFRVLACKSWHEFNQYER